MTFPFRTPSAKLHGESTDTIALALDSGEVIQVRHVRHPRARRMKLVVDEDGARLTLPPRTSLVAGERFARLHRDWLAAQLLQHRSAAQPRLQRDRTDALPLRGVSLPLRWRTGRFARVLLEDAALWLESSARAGEAALTRAVRDFYEAQARADIGRWLPRYLPGLPRPPSRVRLKRTSSQWGSLSPDGTLCLDLALVLARPSAFEYVLVHELCHLIHPDHSRAFWREVEARFPDWHAERDYFRAEGQRLKAALRALIG